jgi:hypothetical protein
LEANLGTRAGTKSPREVVSPRDARRQPAEQARSSVWLERYLDTVEVSGSSPLAPTIRRLRLRVRYRRVAQLVERIPHTDEVCGSSPHAPTTLLACRVTAAVPL